MIQGYFDAIGQLHFEIELIATNEEIIVVDALLDTGFTQWVAMNIQDIENLQWSFIIEEDFYTARGESKFNIYTGSVRLDEREFTIPILGGEEITEVLLGLAWLEERRLVVDRKRGILTLGDPES